MIIGESPEDGEFRELVEDGLAQEWLRTIGSDISKKFGEQLLQVVDLQRESVDAGNDCWVSAKWHLTRQLLGEDVTEIDHERAKTDLVNYMTLTGARERSGETGIPCFDAMHRTIDETLAATSSVEEQAELLSTFIAAQETGKTIYRKTNPPPLAY